MAPVSQRTLVHIPPRGTHSVRREICRNGSRWTLVPFCEKSGRASTCQFVLRSSLGKLHERRNGHQRCTGYASEWIVLETFGRLPSVKKSLLHRWVLGPLATAAELRDCSTTSCPYFPRVREWLFVPYAQSRGYRLLSAELQTAPPAAFFPQSVRDAVETYLRGGDCRT